MWDRGVTFDDTCSAVIRQILEINWLKQYHTYMYISNALTAIFTDYNCLELKDIIVFSFGTELWKFYKCAQLMSNDKKSTWIVRLTFELVRARVFFFPLESSLMEVGEAPSFAGASSLLCITYS